MEALTKIQWQPDQKIKNVSIAVPGVRPTILVTDDAPDTRLILTRTLEFENYGIIEASTGEEALNKAMVHQPDLIILDLMLPRINGFQVMKQLKDLGIGPKVCVISSTDNEKSIRQALDLGAADYIIKPVFPDAIIHKVKQIIGEPIQNRFFELGCSLKGVLSQGNKSIECRVKRISEVGLTLQTEGDLADGEIVNLKCSTLGRVTGRDSPIFARVVEKYPPVGVGRNFDVRLEIVAMPEPQRQKLRAEVIKGKFLFDEPNMN